ncbi:MAG: Fic family protein [Kiritimatiellae bacterium]|nr:Fic family protein [Kiritimatiellia bacterium]
MLEKKLQILNEVIIGSTRPDIAKLLSSLKQQGRVVKLASRVYTTNLTDSPENIVRRNLWTIVGRLWPGARLCHRTALEYAPHDGHVFLAYKYTKKVALPGVVIHFLATPASLDSDYPFMEGLGVSSHARALLENLEPDRTQGGVRKSAGIEAVEERLEAVLAAGGEAALNKLRDEARAVALATGHGAEFSRLDRIAGALQSTRPVDVLNSPVALARAAGEPFDSPRIDIFGRLIERLARMDFPDWAEVNVTDRAFSTFAFFESYFSNCIEGTEFELDEARRIVETGVAIPQRDADSHDILGTYAIASNRLEMSRQAKTGEEFLDILRGRHRVVMSGRPSSRPGMFKTRENRAGETHFVAPERVRGTLKRAFDMSRCLRHPFARAVFSLFVTSEVHPFADGNGRISRIMMNAELVAAGRAKIIVPTVFRPDYIGALRKLSREGEASVLVEAMGRLWDFSRLMKADDFGALRRRLEDSNAFSDDESLILRF